MIFGLALNLHDDVPSSARWFTQTFILCATVLVIALLGGPLAATAYRELRRGRLTIEALFLLTMAGAMVASLQAHITGHGKIYFEVVSILLVVYTLGKAIGARSRAAALAGSRAWAGQLEMCRLVDAEGGARTVPVAEVRPGNLVEVNPGETIAVDGVIRDGIGFVSEAPMTGEPFVVVRRPGDTVLAGMASHDASFRIEATAKGTERQVDRLLLAVEEARERPVSLQARADRIGRWFFPLVVITALGTFTYWTIEIGWEAGLFNAMSVLLVACPCVIGLATPIIVWSALSRLAERGLIVSCGDTIERLAEVDCVMLDKTGTLTGDSFALLDIVTAPSGDDRARLLGWLAAIQERSRHPIARPFAKLPRVTGDAPRIVTLRTVPGRGVEAEVESERVTHTVRIGTPDWIESVARDPLQGALSRQLKATGHRVSISLDGELVAVAVLAERLRDSARETLESFERMELPVEVLTGDTAERATELDLPAVRARMLPDDKRAAVELATVQGQHPLFVGDGINDASALAVAHVGISLSSGADIAKSAADATLFHDDLRAIPWAIELSREALRAVQRSLYRALFYNLIGMTLAACGVLHPVAAVALMVVSSLSLIFSATRLGIDPNHCQAHSTRGNRLLLRQSAFRSVVHALAFALQGVVFALLLDASREAAVLLVGGFTFLGLLLAYYWCRRAIPHALDMVIGMLSFGNLGMLLGWWADNGFAALANDSCCHCATAGMMRPWMWLGMLACANVAMLWFGQQLARPSSRHVAAMFSGGNLGMVLGMIAGGWCAPQIMTGPMTATAFTSFTGMTAGMLMGMLFGTWLAERLIGVARRVGAIPRGQAGGLSYE